MNRSFRPFFCSFSAGILAMASCLSALAQPADYKPGNPLVPFVGMADPHIYVFDGKPYLYSTRDIDSLQTKGRFIMPDWHIWSTEDLLHWRHERTILPVETYMGRSRDCWATETATRNGKYYIYFSDKNRTTGVLVSDSPTGPFRDALGRPLLDTGLTSTKEYDPSVLIDDDPAQTPYIIFGHHRDDDPNLRYYIVRLNDDMISLAEKPRRISFTGNEPVLQANDKPNLHKYGGRYYLSAGSHYAVSDSIYGPYRRTGNSGFGVHGLTQQAHGNYFSWNNQWFHTWCKFHLGKETAYYRESYLTYLHYRDDGTMVDDTALLNRHFSNGVGQYSATWDRIEAEWYMAAEGVVKGEHPTGFEVRSCRNRGYLRYPNIRDVRANDTLILYIRPAAGGWLEARQGGPKGRSLGKVKISAGSSKEYVRYALPLVTDAGVLDLWLTFRGRKNQNLFGIDAFRFVNASTH
jgi:arabinoxylan arabinofuranohydrolase